MIDKQAIDIALFDHAMWKMRLSTAINLGKMHVSVETIRRDDCCDLGRWLYSPTLTDGDKLDPHYQEVKELHAKFHCRAAQVAELALSGKSDEAKQHLLEGGDYYRASAELQSAMKAWKAATRQ